MVVAVVTASGARGHVCPKLHTRAFALKVILRQQINIAKELEKVEGKESPDCIAAWDVVSEIGHKLDWVENIILGVIADEDQSSEHPHNPEYNEEMASREYEL